MIAALGLTPAWQQTLVFDQFVPGAVNRATQALWSASGKVLNVGSAVHHWGHSSLTVCPTGGLTGAAMQQDFARLGIPTEWVRVAAPTRVCTTILDRATRTATELVENAAALTDDELDRYLVTAHQAARTAEIVVASGSLPLQTPRGYYRRLLEGFRGRLLLDFRGPDLRECLALKPWLVKPNREELAATVGRPLVNDTDLLAAMHELRSAGAESVVVTDGPRAGWYAGPGGVECLQPPPLRDIVNPIGCGDCFAAGLAVAAVEGYSVSGMLGFAAAVAGENANHVLAARFPRPTGPTIA